MSCDELTLQAYIDGEVDAVNALRVEEHLRRCAVCAERFRFARALGPRLREQAQSMQAPADLRARIRFAAGGLEQVRADFNECEQFAAADAVG